MIVVYDSVAPEISVDNTELQGNNIITKSMYFGISGHVNEEVTSLTIDGVEKSLYTMGDDYFFGCDVQLKLGINIFNIEATDRAGNISKRQVTVEYIN